MIQILGCGGWGFAKALLRYAARLKFLDVVGMSETADILDLGFTQLKHVKPLGLYELNGRPVAIRLMPGVGKCSLCDRMAKLTVFELWRGKRLDDDASKEHRVWHWCGECDESPFPPFGQDPH